MKLEHLFDNQKPANDDNQQITIGRLAEVDYTTRCEKVYRTIILE